MCPYFRLLTTYAAWLVRRLLLNMLTGHYVISYLYGNYLFIDSDISYTSKQSRGKLSRFSRFLLNRESFPIEYFTRLGIYYYKKLLPRKFSRRIIIFALTAKVFPLDCFDVYGISTYTNNLSLPTDL